MTKFRFEKILGKNETWKSWSSLGFQKFPGKMKSKNRHGFRLPRLHRFSATLHNDARHNGRFLQWLGVPSRMIT